MPLANAAKRAGIFMFVPMIVQPRAASQPRRLQMLAHDMAGFGHAAREREADAVEDRAFAEMHDVGQVCLLSACA